jgi:hypothetical protein
MKYFFIGDEVYVPKHKMVGTVSDKLYEFGNDEVMLQITPKIGLTQRAYDDSKSFHPTFVCYSHVKPLNSKELYRKKIEMVDEGMDLNIPNLLKEKDIVEDAKVRVVDNCMLEKMISYGTRSYLYRTFTLSQVIGKEATLTGKKYVLHNGQVAVECFFRYDTYYIYIHSLQLVKRANIFKRISRKTKKIKDWKFIKHLNKNRTLLWSCVYTVCCVIALLIYIIIKYF